MKLRIDLISMWEAGMIFQGSSGAVGQPAGPDALRGRRPGPRRGVGGWSSRGQRAQPGQDGGQNA